MRLPSRATVPLPQHAGATVPPPQRAVTHPRCREITASYRQQGPGGPSNRNNWDPAQAMTSIFSSLVLALSPIWATLILTTVVSAYSIPTRSMEGTLRVSDVVLAEKVSSLLRLPLERGDLVLFEAPPELLAIAADDGTRVGGRDLFVKRIAAVGGDSVTVLEGGTMLVNGEPRRPPPLACAPEPAAALSAEQAEVAGRVQTLVDDEKITPEEARALLRSVARPEGAAAQRAADTALSRKQRSTFARPLGSTRDEIASTKVIPRGTIFVLGDCASQSVDSRVWGPLAESAVRARPFLRVWPPERGGAIDTTVDRNPFPRASTIETLEERAASQVSLE